MAITVEWLVDERVILSTLEDKVTLKEVESWCETRKYMVDMGLPPVHHISDLRELNTEQIDEKAVQKILHSMPRNLNLGSQLRISHQPVETYVDTPVNDCETQHFTTLEAAMNCLEQHDEFLQELDWQQA